MQTDEPENSGPKQGDDTAGDAAAAPKVLSPEAERALAEAAERRAKQDAEDAKLQKERELGGQKGPDPVRYGDWEKGGIVSDF